MQTVTDQQVNDETVGPLVTVGLIDDSRSHHISVEDAEGLLYI